MIFKIEENLKGIAGITRVTQFKRIRSILIETDEDFDLDAIIFEVKNAVDKVLHFLLILNQ